MVLSTYFIRREIAQLLRKASERQVQFRSLEEAKHLLFFYNQRDAMKLEPIMQRLKECKFYVSTVVFHPEVVNLERMQSLNSLICRKADLNILGMPSPHIIEDVKQLRADILINLGGVKDYTLLYLMLNHPTSFRVGIKWQESDAYDLLISPTDDNQGIDFLCEQILFYLQSIGAK